ncbi:MAG: cytochrome c [Aquificaceae bacterium]|nr:MAG: cytochrome c [Aquificaceae bacterium]
MSKLIKIGATLLVSATVLISGASFAADGAELYKAKGCGACHGADAKTPIMPAYPKIAGQNKEYLIQQMMDIKSGARNNGQTAAMKGIIASVSDDDIKTIAEYLSQLK